MKKRLKENSLLGMFQLQGTPEEQETLNKLVKEVLNTKSGRQLVEDVLASNFVHKPINFTFVPEEKLDNWGGIADAKKGICLTPISTDDTKDEHSHFLDKACSLVHELHHLKIAEDFYTPFPGKRPITQVMYSGLTNEACTYTFEKCVFGKELQKKYPDFKLDPPDFPSNQAELIEGWLRGWYQDRNRWPLVAKYLDMYLKIMMRMAFIVLMNLG